MSTEWEMEALSALLKQQQKMGMMVLTGLPSTCKTEVAHRLASWANCPVLCIQDFLGGGGWGYDLDSDFSPPTTNEEVERHHRKAFLALLNAAHRHLYNRVCNCVIIKASLNTACEFQLLLQLTRGFIDEFRLIIMECKVSNEYLWKLRFEELVYLKDSRRWSRPRSWIDIEKAGDLHLPRQGIYDDAHHAIIWLVVDPFYDLDVHHKFVSHNPLPDEFNNAIEYLLTTGIREFYKNHYVVDYGELRMFLFDKEINAAALKARREALCQRRNCVFKYREKALEDHIICGACEDQIISGPAYTCHFCIASLHKNMRREGRHRGSTVGSNI